MAILKDTVINGGLTINGSENVNGGLTINGSENVNGGLKVNNIIQAYRYGNSISLPAITIDKPGSGCAGIGSMGKDYANTIKFGKTTNMLGGDWITSDITWKFDGKVNSSGSLTATSFVKSGETDGANKVLMADGSVKAKSDFIGPQGLRGPQGEIGPAGERGPQGEIGPAGERGPAGPVGPASTVPGPSGPQGPAGPTGPAGPAGANGTNGARGPAGPVGAKFDFDGGVLVITPY